MIRTTIMYHPQFLRISDFLGRFDWFLYIEGHRAPKCSDPNNISMGSFHSHTPCHTHNSILMV